MPGAGLIADSPALVNYVETVRPTCVSSLGGIVKSIDHSGELDSELHQTDLPHCAAFRKTLRTQKDNVVVQIVRVLPHVASVCLADINQVECHLIFVLLVQLV